MTDLKKKETVEEKPVENNCHALVDATLVRGQEFAKVLRVSTKIR